MGEVLALAGLARTGRDWDPVAARLDGRHRLVRFDRPGLAGVAPETGMPDLTREVLRIAAVAARHGLVRPVLLAHSAAALHAEAYLRVRPDAVRGLVLVDPSWSARPRPRGLHAAAVTHRMAAVVTRAPGRLTGPAAVFAEWLAYRDWITDLAVLRRGHPAPDVPVVVLTAVRRMRPAAARRWREGHVRLVALFPRARQVVLTDAGHLVARDRPDAVAAAVDEVAG
jgi:pimeloyl-ACP methyl ester carboxylesterase